MLAQCDLLSGSFYQKLTVTSKNILLSLVVVCLVIFFSPLICFLLGPCHTYIQQRGRTGGFQDLWCPHDTKIGSKIEPAQESSSDVDNLVRTMKKFPTLHFCDDPCHLVR